MTSEVRTTASYGALWALLSEMRIEEPGAVRTFERALAEENGWSAAHAASVSREYRRFLYLAGMTGPEITPSPDVDKAWHLHLTYSRHYWDVLCREILGRPFHHVPSAGGEDEDARHSRQYEETLALYETTFREAPPPDVWPRPAGDDLLIDRQEEEEEEEEGIEDWPAAGIVAVGLLLVAGALVGGLAGFAFAGIIGAGSLFVVAHLRHFSTDRPRRRRSGADVGADCGGASCGGGCGGGD